MSLDLNATLKSLSRTMGSGWPVELRTPDGKVWEFDNILTFQDLAGEKPSKHVIYLKEIPRPPETVQRKAP